MLSSWRIVSDLGSQQDLSLREDTKAVWGKLVHQKQLGVVAEAYKLGGGTTEVHDLKHFRLGSIVTDEYIPDEVHRRINEAVKSEPAIPLKAYYMRDLGGYVALGYISVEIERRRTWRHPFGTSNVRLNYLYGTWPKKEHDTTTAAA